MGGQAPKISPFHKGPLMIFGPNTNIFPIGGTRGPCPPQRRAWLSVNEGGG